jgi:GT2 family glycosyltransferase
MSASRLRSWTNTLGDVLARGLTDPSGLPHRVVETRKLAAEIARAVPYPAARHAEVLAEGHLERGLIEPAAPEVSVVIPVYGKLDFTLRCLVSLGARTETTSFEVIVVDDGSPDDTERVLSRCPGLRYARNEVNGGFITSCNRGASMARGRFVCFLNNDTVVLPGWLDELVDTARRVPLAGLVGSRLIYPSYALQESGGLVWRDASAANFGNGRDPFHPRYGYLRDVDYCSAASVLLEKALFDELGGFDRRYAPCYYEDTDLAFKVREAGRRVLVQPASRVVHFEGATAGTDLSTGPKRHQVENRRVFFERWRAVLARHGDEGDTSPTELDRWSRRTTLVLGPDAEASSPLVSRLAGMRALGCRVAYAPLLPRPAGLALVAGHRAGLVEALGRVGVEALFAPYELSAVGVLRERAASLDVVVVRAGAPRGALAAARRRGRRAKLVVDLSSAPGQPSVDDLALARAADVVLAREAHVTSLGREAPLAKVVTTAGRADDDVLVALFRDLGLPLAPR